MAKCENCGAALVGGPRRKYCGSRCRVYALRKRRRAAGLTAEGRPLVTAQSVTESVTDKAVTERITRSLTKRFEREIDIIAEGLDTLLTRVNGLEKGGQKVLSKSEYKLIRKAMHPGGNASEKTKSAAWMAFQKLNIEPLTDEEHSRIKELRRKTQEFKKSSSK